MRKDKEVEKPLTTSAHGDQTVDDLPEIVKEVRLDGSHVPLTIGDKCASGEQIDLGCSVWPNDCILIKTSNGKEARVAPEMLEKGKKLVPLAAAFLSVVATVVLSGERRRTVLYLCLGGIGLVSFVTYLLLRWTTHKACWSMSLQAVVEPEHTTVTASENGGNDLSLLTKKCSDDGRLLDHTEELKRSHPSQDSECAKSSYSTPTTARMSLTHKKENYLAFGHMQMEDASPKKSSKQSIGPQRRMSKKRSDRRLSLRRKGSANMISRPELIDDPRYADIPLRYKIGCLYDMEEARR